MPDSTTALISRTRTECPQVGLAVSMAFPRIRAAIFVLLLIGSFVLLSVSAVAHIGPTLTHGPDVEHGDGTIVAIDPNMAFVLRTATGQKIYFQCDSRCRNGMAHMLRHLHEHAHTDVYYLEKAGHILLAEDVD